MVRAELIAHSAKPFLRAIRSLDSWQRAFLDDFIMFCSFELELDASSIARTQNFAGDRRR